MTRRASHFGLIQRSLATATCATLVSVALFGAVAPVVRAAVAATCSVSWTNQSTPELWDNPKDWSTGSVPTTTSDVCIETPFLSFPTVRNNVAIHSLHLGNDLIVGNGAPVSFTVSGAVNNSGYIDLQDSTLSAASITGNGGINTNGNSTVTSPRYTVTGPLSVEGGTARLTDVPMNLHDGTWTAGQVFLSGGGVLTLPGDINTLDGELVTSGAPAGIHDTSGHDALSALSLVTKNGFLALSPGTLRVPGNLTADGTVILGGYAGAGTLLVGGSFTLGSGSAGLFLDNQSELSARSVHIGAGSFAREEGTIVGNVTNDGALEAIGRSFVSGSYAQSATGTLEAYVAAPGSTTSALTVSGPATLGGALVILIFEAPAPGTTFSIMQFASSSGSFARAPVGFALQRQPHYLVAVAEPQIAITPASNVPGGKENVALGSFSYEEHVDIYLDSTATAPLAAVKVSRAGDFTGVLQLPPTISTGRTRSSPPIPAAVRLRARR